MAGTNSYLVRSGNLRKRLTFQVKSAEEDRLGQQVIAWADAFTCWGEIQPLTGRELIAAQAEQSSVTHSITVRFRPELSDPKRVAAMRVLYRGRFGLRVFDIHAALNENERDRVVTLQAEEGLNNG